jgi:vacuolar-type H+-ATPase subunit C/Vma6
VSGRWEDVNARARGLATHLVGATRLDALTRLPDLAALGRALREDGYPVEQGAATPSALELALRRTAAARLRVIARWCGPRVATLSALFEDEDRRSLRAVLRGAVERAPVELRLAGLVPTPALPERALATLAALPTPAGVAALLTAWTNPYGPALLPLAAAAEPDLFQIEAALNRTFARRARRAARRTPRLAAYVSETIDLENAVTALLLATQGQDVAPGDVFLPGGARIGAATFAAAAAARHTAAAGRLLAAAFAGSPLAAPFAQCGDDPTGLEPAVLRARIHALAREARVDPLGPAPLLAYGLRLRAESMDLQRVVWGTALGAPRAAQTGALVGVGVP